jgi:hypothetical protein
VTLQSLSEFYAVVTRKRIMPTAEAAAQIGDWLSFFPSIAVSATCIRAESAERLGRMAGGHDG